MGVTHPNFRAAVESYLSAGLSEERLEAQLVRLGVEVPADVSWEDVGGFLSDEQAAALFKWLTGEVVEVAL